MVLETNIKPLQTFWQTAIEFVGDNKANNTLTANVVYAYALALLKDDDGYPITPAPHHRLWMELVCDPTIRRLLIISPPDSAKTTWLVSAYLGAYVGFYPNKSVIIGSVDGSTAEKRSNSLRNMTETPEWRYMFPGVVQNDTLTWQSKEWSLTEGRPNAGRMHPTVRGYGTHASIIGTRADLLIGDDLLDTSNTRTKHARDQFAIWFEGPWIGRMKAQVGRCILIGTSWNADDYYNHIVKKPLGWTICHVPSLVDNNDGFYASVTYAN